jgi:K+-transporting ATPase ATPase B chain
MQKQKLVQVLSSSRRKQRSSGVDTPSGIKIRKGAFDAIRDIVTKNGNTVPAATAAKVKSIAANGGTPLVVAVNNEVKGVIELQDIIKPGIQERFARLRKMGVKTVMVTEIILLLQITLPM